MKELCSRVTETYIQTLLSAQRVLFLICKTRLNITAWQCGLRMRSVGQTPTSQEVSGAFRVISCEIRGEPSGTAAGFSLASFFLFLLLIMIPPLLHTFLITPRGVL
jgi:hypothetical protein